MCVICYKPAGVELPDCDTIYDMYESNPHGAGVMWSRNGDPCVHYVKGLFSADNLLDAVDSIPDALNAAVAIHCRIMTSGAMDPNNCHPFACSHPCDGMPAAGVESGIMLMHNGVLDCVAPTATTSDTMEFAARVVRPLLELAGDAHGLGALDDGPARTIIEAVSDPSRLLFMAPGGEVLTFGRWIRNADGCHYSNLNHEWCAWINHDDGRAESPELSELPEFDACELCKNYNDCYLWGRLCESEADAWECAELMDYADVAS